MAKIEKVQTLSSTDIVFVQHRIQCPLSLCPNYAHSHSRFRRVVAEWAGALTISLEQMIGIMQYEFLHTRPDIKDHFGPNNSLDIYLMQRCNTHWCWLLIAVVYIVICVLLNILVVIPFVLVVATHWRKLYNMAKVQCSRPWNKSAVENVFGDQKKEIPHILYLTYKSRADVPDYVLARFERNASNYDIRFFDDTACLQFLEDNYEPEVAQRFTELPIGAHKADLWRYCALYLTGGVYLDIKTVLVDDLDRLFGYGQNRFYSMLDVCFASCTQGIIASPPGEPIFLYLIDQLLRMDLDYTIIFYHFSCMHFYRLIQTWKQQGRLSAETDLGSKKSKGKAFSGKDNLTDKCQGTPASHIVLFQETVSFFCPQKDRYGLCSLIEDRQSGRIVAKTRDSDYPWIGVGK